MIKNSVENFIELEYLSFLFDNLVGKIWFYNWTKFQVWKTDWINVICLFKLNIQNIYSEKLLKPKAAFF